MRRSGKWLGRLLLALVLAAAVIGLWNREEITRLLAVNSLFAEDRIVADFSSMGRMFLTTPLPRGAGPVSALSEGDYLDYNSGIDRMGRIVALGGRLDDFAAGLRDSFAPPGETWQYVSIDTHVIGMVIRGATGRTIPGLMAEKIIAPLGQEADGTYITDGAGVAFVLGGLNLTTGDYARFGQMILQQGRYGGQQVVPADWIAASTTPSAPTAPPQMGYGHQWWMPADARPGEVLGRGIYGQYLYIDQQHGVVITVTAADRGFRDPGVNDANIAMMRRIAGTVSGE